MLKRNCIYKNIFNAVILDKVFANVIRYSFAKLMSKSKKGKLENKVASLNLSPLQLLYGLWMYVPGPWIVDSRLVFEHPGPQLPAEQQCRY